MLCLTMPFRFDWDMLPGCPLPVLDPTWGSVLCCDEVMPPAPMPLAVGRGTDGFPKGCLDMMTVSKTEWGSCRRQFSLYLKEHSSYHDLSNMKNKKWCRTSGVETIISIYWHRDEDRPRGWIDFRKAILGLGLGFRKISDFWFLIQIYLNRFERLLEVDQYSEISILTVSEWKI